MTDTRAGAFESSNGAGRELETAEHAVSFRFDVTWSTLFRLAEPVKPQALIPAPPRSVENGRAPVPSVKEPPFPEPVRESPPVRESEPVRESAPHGESGPGEPPSGERSKAAPGSEMNWEMTIPKMVRPASRTAPPPVKEEQPSRPVPVSAPPPAPTAPPATKRSASSKVVLPPPRTKPAPRQDYVVTEYQIPIADTEYFPVSSHERSGPVVYVVLGLAAMAVFALVLWIGTRSGATQFVQVATALGERGWVRQHSPIDAGGRLDRRLILFRPSINSTDSELEFNWMPATSAIGWVFRARDAANYYAMRLRLLGAGRAATLAEERFTVADGAESPHYEKFLALPQSDGALKVKMSVVDSTFTLYLQGEPLDTWTDTTLSTGGLGFLEERNEPAEVQSVRLAYSRVPQSNLAAMLQSLRQSFK